MADDDHAEDGYRLSIEHLRRSQVAPELARSHLLYGEWLRRRRRRRGAREQLRVACELFGALGMAAFGFGKTLSTWLASSREVPDFRPRAARNGKAMAPPTRIRSALEIRLPNASNLSATLAPPSTTTYGR